MIHDRASRGIVAILTTVYTGDASAVANPQVDSIGRQAYALL